MKRNFLLLSILAVALASCSTQYKSTQTPDDVYYSPAPPSTGENNTTKDEAKNQDKYESYTSPEDRYLHMKVNNRYRWSSIDDYSYWYDTRYNEYTYNYNNHNGYNSNYSVYSGYNHCSCSCFGNCSIFYPGYYNPYIGSFYTGYYTGYSGYSNGNVYIINPKVVHPNVNRPQLGGYSTHSSSSSSSGSSIKKIFSSNSSRSSNNGETYRSNDRTYTPSSGSSSSNSSSSGSSSNRVSRPGRN